MLNAYHIRISLKPTSPSAGPRQTSQSFEEFTPTYLFEALPNHKARPVNTRQSAPANTHHTDYRFGPVRIDWVDSRLMKKGAFNGPGKGREHGRGPAEAVFVPHKTGSTNLPEGVIRIFRDSPNKYSNEQGPSLLPPDTLLPTEQSSDDVVLAVLAVPSWMTPSDFLGFVAPAAEGISHLRIIRDSAPNRSIVVIKFRNPAEASDFAEAYNGKPFNSMEPETCHVVHVLSVEIDADDSVSQAISRLGSAQSSTYELPTCPVCLERMDSAVTGLITVPCSHTFHCMCLSKWGDSRCPVCRYSQTLLSSHPTTSASSRTIPFSNPATPTLSTCSACPSTTNLWICLICGNIGCGRYGLAHAHAHYDATAHLYALELETQRVWDYAGDGYVHRLIQNKADGKLVELPSAASSAGAVPREAGLGPSQADALSAEKIEAIGIEYSYLLTSQLDSQRAYYEEQTGELRNQLDELRALVDTLSQEFQKERIDAKELELAAEKKAEGKIAEVTKERLKAEHKVEKLTDLARKLEKELKEERAVSQGLMENLQKMKEKVEVANQVVEGSNSKIRELEDQVRDVMFFLEAKTKIEEGGGVEAEAAGGSVELPVTAPPPATTKKKKRKG